MDSNHQNLNYESRDCSSRFSICVLCFKSTVNNCHHSSTWKRSSCSADLPFFFVCGWYECSCRCVFVCVCVMDARTRDGIHCCLLQFLPGMQDLNNICKVWVCFLQYTSSVAALKNVISLWKKMYYRRMGLCAWSFCPVYALDMQGERQITANNNNNNSQCAVWVTSDSRFQGGIKYFSM